LMRTLSSEMRGGRGWERKETMFSRAAGFWAGATESSRSYETVSTVRPRDFSRNRGEEDGTVLS
jgi:hypothetical protein